eukprot:TRINITY_DN686_c0_g1_i2.p1 TRINITY_DN686_c0_g1~~TRINITY_DN686_c0_g1_i2.p1  ORF type:complete len:180 (-),score=24.64 TRINITY_DN686_c0_g1_i2:189-728(-)
MIFVSARICLLVLVCVVSATSALDDVAKPTAVAAAAVYGSVCEERIGGLDLVLLVDECNACVVSFMDTQTACTYNPGTRTCSAKATGMDVRSRPEHCEMLTPPALISESGVWGQLERKRDELEVEAVQDVQAIQAAQAVTTKQARTMAAPRNCEPPRRRRPSACTKAHQTSVRRRNITR